MILGDLRRKARWLYKSDRWPSLIKVLLADGSMAMVFYRAQQWSRRWHLVPLEMLICKTNAFCCSCIIGRGAEFGPGLVFVHASGLFINGKVRGGTNVTLYQQVTLGGEGNDVPSLGDDVLVAAGAKVVGRYKLGDHSVVAANSLVVANVPAYTTVMGVPARAIWKSTPKDLPLSTPNTTVPDGAASA